jgi:hypothetical protein
VQSHRHSCIGGKWVNVLTPTHGMGLQKFCTEDLSSFMRFLQVFLDQNLTPRLCLIRGSLIIVRSCSRFVVPSQFSSCCFQGIFFKPSLLLGGNFQCTWLLVQPMQSPKPFGSCLEFILYHHHPPHAQIRYLARARLAYKCMYDSYYFPV